MARFITGDGEKEAGWVGVALAPYPPDTIYTIKSQQ